MPWKSGCSTFTFFSAPPCNLGKFSKVAGVCSEIPKGSRKQCQNMCWVYSRTQCLGRVALAFSYCLMNLPAIWESFWKLQEFAVKSLRGPEDYLPGARGWLVDGAVYGTSISISESKNLRIPGPQNLRESENPKGSQYQYQYLSTSESQNSRISES